MDYLAADWYDGMIIILHTKCIAAVGIWLQRFPLSKICDVASVDAHKIAVLTVQLLLPFDKRFVAVEGLVFAIDFGTLVDGFDVIDVIRLHQFSVVTCLQTKRTYLRLWFGLFQQVVVQCFQPFVVGLKHLSHIHIFEDRKK